MVYKHIEGEVHKEDKRAEYQVVGSPWSGRRAGLVQESEKK